MRGRLIAASVSVMVASLALTGVVVAKVHTRAKTHAAIQDVKLVIKSDSEHGKKGPDGKWHDAYLPADFTVAAGAKVVVTVLNYDDGSHSFSSSSLNVNALIKGGKSNKPSSTTFSFIAPKKSGKYAWWCAMPCDPWAMSHNGYMRGIVTVGR